MAQTLLAHLARRLGTGEEDLATEALAYILQTPEAAGGMLAHARRWHSEIPQLETYRTQDWDAEDQAIPDLVGVARDGTTPLIVEAKFGAALTPNQPVTYLRRLLDREAPGLLLFLVPQRRRVSLWNETVRRCSDAGLPFGEIDATRFHAKVGTVVLGITSWTDLLNEIEGHLTPPGQHQRTIAEIEQVRGVCARAEERLFQPFGHDFLGGDTGRRVMDLDSVINATVDNLAITGRGSSKGLRWSAATTWFGRYVRIAGWECLLHVNYARWGQQRQTPIWLRISDKKAHGNQDLLAALDQLAQATPSRFLNDDGRMQIPIFVPPDVERDEVMAQIDAQLAEVFEILNSVDRDG